MKSGVVGLLFGAKKRRGTMSPVLIGLYVREIPKRTWSLSVPGSFHNRFAIGLRTLERLRIAGQFFRQELHGDAAAELRVLGLEHDAHAAAAERFEDVVVGDALADHEN